MTDSGEPPRSYHYRIDADDRITDVDDAWVAFARENDAGELARAVVLGRPIWDFIAGDETRRLYRSVLDRVRQFDEVRVLPFRCDSPGLRRFMQLKIVPHHNGDVSFFGLLVRSEPRKPMALLSLRRNPGASLVTMCSWCKRVRLDDASWVEVETAMESMHGLDSDMLPDITHGICPKCRDDIHTGS